VDGIIEVGIRIRFTGSTGIKVARKTVAKNCKVKKSRGSSYGQYNAIASRRLSFDCLFIKCKVVCVKLPNKKVFRDSLIM